MMPARTYFAVALLALAATASGQWVEDSALSGPNVSNLVYDRNAGYVVGTSWDEGIFGIRCATNRRDGGRSVHWPLGLAHNALTGRFYAAHGNWEDDTVIVVGGGPYFNLYRRIPLSGASKPLWDSVSNRVYVSCALENEVAVIDCESDSVADYIRVGREPERPELNTRHRRLYVRNRDSETVSIIDIETNEVVETARMSNVPTCGYYCPAVDKYYCAALGRIVVICGAGDSVLTSIDLPVGSGATAFAGLGGDTLIAVSAYGGPEGVHFIDTRADTVASSILVGRSPQALAYSPGSGLLYCACASSDEVAVLDAGGSGVLRRLAVGDFPKVLAVAPEYGYVYVGHANGEYVYAIRDTVTGVAEPRGPVARRPAMRAWPTPFRHHLTVELPGDVAPRAVQVRSTDGRLVAELECRLGRDGLVAEWNGRDHVGGDAPEGVYIVTARSVGARAVSVLKVR